MKLYLIKSLDDFSLFSECGKLYFPQEQTRTFHLTSLRIHTKSLNTMTGVKVSNVLLILLLGVIPSSFTKNRELINAVIF